MLLPDTPDERLCFSTTPILQLDSSKVLGTGFFFRKNVNEKKHYKVFLITAKHVLEESDKFSYFLRTTDNVLKAFSFAQNVIIQAPNDADVAGVDITSEVVSLGEQFRNVLVPSDLIKDNETLLKEYPALNPVMLYGYPTGLFDDVTYFPLIRTGFTAFHPGLNYKGAEEGRLNIANYEVDSGAPVFTMPQSMQYSKSLKAQVAGGLPMVFLGIHHEGYSTHSHLGLNEATEEDGMDEQMNIASYIKASILESILDWSKRTKIV